MTDATRADAGSAREDDIVEGPVMAEGVDEDPIEKNRRLFEGWRAVTITSFAAFYSFFHIAALNGLSIERWTGIELPLLPQLPMETWDFRVVHIAGALILGFLLFSSRFFGDDKPTRDTKMIGWVALALLIPAAVAMSTALGFAIQINSGELPQMGGLTTWAAFPGTDLYTTEVRWYGIPLLVATFGAIVLGWFEDKPRDRFAMSDIVLACCAVVVAAYLIPIYGTAARNSVGTPFVPVGVAFAATAGSALILELTRRVAGMALVIITGVFLVYTFTAHLLPGILAVQTPYTWQRFFGFLYTDAGILGRPRRCRRPTSSSSSSSRPSFRPQRSATTSSTSPSRRRGVRGADRPRWRSSPPA
jgi:TRAP-type uncharacterized transport system fused permease subunit